MSVNSSSSSNSSLHSEPLDCSNFTVFVLSFAAFHVTRAVLVLPLSIFILYLGLQQWRQQHSSTSTSHSDIFTYHVAVMELLWALGSAIYFCGTSTSLPEMMMMGYSLSTITFCGATLFHVLTCVERYLAVVHPITYLGLKNVHGVRIRNISIGCVWLFCFVWMFITAFYFPALPTIEFFCILVFSLVVVSFCSISVLCVLIRPGPGEGGRGRERVDQSKQRAFVTVMAIMGVLLMWFGGLILAYALEVLSFLSHSATCVVRVSTLWGSLPSSLVLPLLYLFRAGKLSCCCSNHG